MSCVKLFYVLASFVLLTGIAGCSSTDYNWAAPTGDRPALETPFGDLKTTP
jgi:hypothetical protein